jgi:hypothetical protein
VTAPSRKSATTRTFPVDRASDAVVGRVFTAAESERLERLARVVALATDAFGDADDARQFLETARPLLEGRAPGRGDPRPHDVRRRGVAGTAPVTAPFRPLVRAGPLVVWRGERSTSDARE